MEKIYPKVWFFAMKFVIFTVGMTVFVESLFLLAKIIKFGNSLLPK